MALVKIQVRRDTAANWTATNPVLAVGEPGLETDTGKVKYGDGVRNWNTLPYSSGVALGSSTPPAAGTAAAGTSETAARADHSHALPSNLSATTVATTGNATVGGSLTVSGPLVGGVHKHTAADIDNLSSAVFARIVSAIKAGPNVTLAADSAAETLTISSSGITTVPLAITANPADVTSTDGSASFTATASGGSSPPTYSWQSSSNAGVSWSDVPNSGGSSLRLTGLTAANDGTLYRLQASSGGELVYSASATLRTAQIAITSQPPDATVNIGELVRLAATAVAGTAQVFYQWQRRGSPSEDWVVLPEATQSVFAFATTAATDADGDQYQCIASALGATATSRTATVVVRASPPSIVVQPENTQDSSGAATFSVTVTGGDGSLTYEWQRLGGSSSSWTQSSAFAAIASGTSGVSGQDTATLSLTGQGATQHLRGYRLKATDGLGRFAMSSAATLRTLSLTITGSPSNVAATDGSTLAANAFQAAGTADGGVTYQWQKSVDNGATYTNISGATSANYGGIAVAFADDGADFRCAITGDGQTLFTSSANLAVTAPALSITVQPTDVTTSGGTATVSFSHTGGPSVTPAVRWEYRAPGGQWGPFVGATSTTLVLTNWTVANNGWQLRGFVQRGPSFAQTNVITVTVPGVLFTLQPLSATKATGEAVTFSMDFTPVACPSPSIQWQQRTSSTGSWSNVSGATAKTLTLSSLTTGSSGYQYRAGVTCSGTTTHSDVATLTVTVPPLIITTQPTDATAALGQATFTFAFAGGDSSGSAIIWERNPPGGAWSIISGAAFNTLIVSGITASASGTQYRATVTKGGQSATTRSAVLSVSGAFITLNPVDAIAVNGSASFTFDFSTASCADPSILWEKKQTAATAWEPISTATGKTLALQYLAPSDSNVQYRASVSCGDSTSYSSAATLTVPSYEFFFSQPGSMSVKTGESVTFSFQGRFPASEYKARWQSRKVGATNWTYYTPASQSQQSVTFEANPQAHHSTEWRVEIALPGGGRLYSDVATLTVDLATSSIAVDVAGTSDLIGIAYAQGAFVALTSDQTALIRRSTNNGKSWTLSFLPSSQYWDGVVATSQGTLIAYATGTIGSYIGSGGRWIAREIAQPATLAISSDGGATWRGAAFPFFVGGGLRLFSFPYQNAVVAFYLVDDPGSGGSPYYNSTSVGSAMRMAVSLDNGTSWASHSTPLAGSTLFREVSSAAMSDTGILVATSTLVSEVGGKYVSSRATRRILYRNVASQGWGSPLIAAQATVGISSGVTSTPAGGGGVVGRPISRPRL